MWEAKDILRADCIAIGRYEGREEGISIGVEKGKQEGISIGVEKGKTEGIIQTAVNMIKEGFDINVVSKVTGLAQDVVDGLVNPKVQI